MSSVSDALWASRAALLGDRGAFNRLVEAYQSPIRRLLLHLTGGDDALSADLAQDTFVKAWLGIASFRATAKFSTWLFRIACNTFYDYTRSSHAQQSRSSVSVSACEHLSAAPKNATRDVDLTAALQHLKEAERTAVLLFYMEDMPVKKVAAVMGCPPGTVQSHLHRGREKLAGLLKNKKNEYL